MSRIFFFTAFFLGILMNSFAQTDTLWNMRGERFAVTEYSLIKESGKDSIIAYTLLNGKAETEFLDEFFMIKKKDGKIQKLYHPELGGFGELNFDQMKYYLSGKYDTRNIKISPLIGIGAGFIGIVGAMIPPVPVENGHQSFDVPLGLAAPLVYTAVVGNVKVDDHQINQTMHVNSTNEYYLMGCEDAIRRKRTKHSLIGGSIGFTFGIGLLVLISNL